MPVLKKIYYLFFVTLHFKTIDCFLSIGRIFFEEISQIADIRIAAHPKGMSKGFAHVDFSTVEAPRRSNSLFSVFFSACCFNLKMSSRLSN
jgi:hypothetical protein